MQELQTVASHIDKEKVIVDHFNSVLVFQETQKLMLNWQQLHVPTIQNTGLNSPFSIDEVWGAINDFPVDKAPGRDGFIGVFFRSCWATIKSDVMLAFDQVYCNAGQKFCNLNTTMVALLPKKDGATKMYAFRPTILIHSVAKLIAKVMSIRVPKIIYSIISSSNKLSKI